jgi:hypothetical protein
MHDPLDLERLPHEIGRSMLWDHATFPQEVAAGLSAFPEGDTVRIEDGDGETVATVPLYRLAAVNLAYLEATIIDAAGDLTTLGPDAVAELEQAVAAIRAGQVYAGPDDDFLVVPTAVADGTLEGALILGRATGVPDWPIEDGPDMDVAHDKVLSRRYRWGAPPTPDEAA